MKQKANYISKLFQGIANWTLDNNPKFNKGQHKIQIADEFTDGASIATTSTSIAHQKISLIPYELYARSCFWSANNLST